MFENTILLYKGLIPVAKTRWPWFHKQFSGYPGWKQDFINEFEEKMGLEKDQRGYLKVLFKFFGKIVILDGCRKEFWKYPRIYLTDTRFEVGWLYWAIDVFRGHIYYTSRQTIETYKKITDEDMLKEVLIAGLRTGDTETIINSMNMLLRLGWQKFTLEHRVVAKNGDRIEVSFTYPSNLVTIHSVNGIQNHVLAAHYHKILTGDEATKARYLELKENMPAKLRAWVEEDR